MALSQAEVQEARDWIRNQGLGTTNADGHLMINGGDSGTAAQRIAGAASIRFGNQDLSQVISQIGGNQYNQTGVNNWLTNNASQVSDAANNFKTERLAAQAQPPAAAVAPPTLNAGQPAPQNPYLGQMANDIARRSGLALNLGLSDIRGNAVGVGGLGGSRQGVAEGTAIGQANDSLQGNLSNLFGTDYTNQQGRDLQRYGIDVNDSTARRGQDLQKYNIDQGNALGYAGQNLQRYGMDQNTALGYAGQDLSRYGINVNGALTMGNQALQNQGQNQNFYSTQRGQDLQQVGLGASLYGQGNAGYVGQGQGVYGIGSTQQQAPWNVNNNASGNISPYTGFGSTNTQSGSYGGGANGFAGGALAGAQIGKNLGFSNNSSDPYNYGQGTSYNGNYARM